MTSEVKKTRFHKKQRTFPENPARKMNRYEFMLFDAHNIKGEKKPEVMS